MRRQVLRAAVTGQIAVAQIVSEDEHDVRTTLAGLAWRGSNSRRCGDHRRQRASQNDAKNCLHLSLSRIRSLLSSIHRAMPWNLRFEITQTRPAQSLVQVNFSHDHRSPFLGKGE